MCPYLELPITEKPIVMNTVLKKRNVIRLFPALRTLALSVLFFIFIIMSLYVLINSPA